VRATNNDEWEKEEHARGIIEAIERKPTRMGKLRRLKDDHKKDRKSQESNPGTPDAILNTIQPKPHHERDG
jgi:hypothetical protein